MTIIFKSMCSLIVALCFSSFNTGMVINNISNPVENHTIQESNLSDIIEQKEIAETIKISELVNNKSKYDGKEVQISGKCTKINANIMGRNWIHLKDGSMDEFDLVITSDQVVEVGKEVTMKGIVVVDKDFGAGYRYDLIIELGRIVTDK